MDGRDAFLTMARDRHLEFSSLRRCKYSSLAMLYELHTQAMVIILKIRYQGVIFFPLLIGSRQICLHMQYLFKVSGDKISLYSL